MRLMEHIHYMLLPYQSLPKIRFTFESHFIIPVQLKHKWITKVSYSSWLRVNPNVVGVHKTKQNAAHDSINRTDVTNILPIANPSFTP